MDTAPTVLLGVVEGITEFLPISSTGHLLIAEHWLGRRSDLFNVGIQAGAMLAVIGVFWRRLLQLCHLGDAANRDYVLKLALAFVIMMIGGLAVKKMGWELPETVTPVALALIIGGIANKLPFQLVVKTAIRSADQLKGQSIAISRSSRSLFVPSVVRLQKTACPSTPLATSFGWKMWYSSLGRNSSWALTRNNVTT